MSDEPRVGGTVPIAGPVEAGKDYWWCACGRSSKQPFCDGSHAGSQFTPRKLTAPQDCEAVLCGCKRTDRGPFCDCIHNDLSATRNAAGGEELLPAACAPITARGAS